MSTPQLAEGPKISVTIRLRFGFHVALSKNHGVDKGPFRGGHGRLVMRTSIEGKGAICLFLPPTNVNVHRLLSRTNTVLQQGVCAPHHVGRDSRHAFSRIPAVKKGGRPEIL